MKKLVSRAVAVAAMMVGLGLTSSAHAVWTFDTATTAVLTLPGVGDPNVTSVGGAYVVNAGVTNGGTTLATGGGAGGFSSNWSSNALTFYSGNGNGMVSPEASGGAVPNHAMDNTVNTEAMIVGFSSSMVLSSVGLGYTSNNVYVGGVLQENTSGGVPIQVDVSLFRYTGSGTPPALGAITGGAMAGWELVGNYGDFIQDTSNPYNLVNSAAKGSSWWMISAYNSGFTGAGETRGGLDNGNDFFKVYALAGTKCTSTVAGVCGPGTSVPEPGSLGLAAVAILGLGAARRRRFFS